MPKLNKLEKTALEPKPTSRQKIAHSPARYQHILHQEISRPIDAINRLFNCLRPEAKLCPLLPGRILQSSEISQQPQLWLIAKGGVSVYRIYDNLKVSMSEGPIVVGLQELFSPFRRHKFQVSRDSIVYSIPVEQASQIITEQLLWKDVAELISYYLRMMSYRDEHLVTNSSYTIVRAKILEYFAKKDILVPNRIGIANYIKSTTTLSRSLIYFILSNLSEGGYIVIKKGKLTEISHLPEKF